MKAAQIKLKKTNGMYTRMKGIKGIWIKSLKL